MSTIQHGLYSHVSELEATAAIEGEYYRRDYSEKPGPERGSGSYV